MNLKASIDKTKIIDDIVNLEILCLGFSIEGAVDQIPASRGRDKPILAMIKGTGGGQTRAIEEMRLLLQLGRSDCLVIPITFNYHYGYNFLDESQPFKNQNLLIGSLFSVAISIIRRMFAVFYAIPLEETDFINKAVLLTQGLTL